MTDPAASFMAAVAGAAERSHHPYGGMEFVRAGEAVCYAIIAPLDGNTVEISGMYAPVRGGGRHAMSLLSLLADLHGVRLCLVAASSVPERMSTEKIVEWYRKFGFLSSLPGRFGVQMTRTPKGVVGEIGPC